MSFDQSLSHRLQSKSVKQSIISSISRDFNLAPILRPVRHKNKRRLVEKVVLVLFLVWRARTRIFLYCFTSSTRRFFALPSSVSLEATGAYGPSP